MKSDRPSSTARLIAASTLLLASDPRRASLVAPGASALCERLLSGTPADRMLAKSASFGPTRALWRWIEGMVLPGIVAHYWHRKRWIERRCRAAIADGFERVVVLGAGFDTLALRLAAEFPHIDWLEIDHPATQATKRRALGREPVPGIRFVPADLAADPLPTGCFDDGRATLVIAEGLLMYLPSEAIDRLFRTLAALRAPAMRWMFSFMSKWPDGSTGFLPRSGWVERWLAWRGEPFTWSLEPERIDGFLQTFGLKPIEIAHSQEFAIEACAQGTSLVGENLVLSERAFARSPADPGRQIQATKDQI